MSFLSGKNVLLGISGGIAAYKAPFILRLLKKRSCEVKVIMTTSAKDFVSPLTLSTLSENNVLSTFTSDDKNDTWNNHVSIAKWADLFIIAPATSNIISSMASAKCDNLLIATYLSFNGDVYIAPSMDLDMYENSANQKNIDSLIKNKSAVSSKTNIKSVEYLWDIFDVLSENIKRDYNLLYNYKNGTLHPSCVLIQEDSIIINNNAEVLGGSVLDASNGPIIIDEGARFDVIKDKSNWLPHAENCNIPVNVDNINILGHRITPPFGPVQFDNAFIHFHC